MPVYSGASRAMKQSKIWVKSREPRSFRPMSGDFSKGKHEFFPPAASDQGWTHYESRLGKNDLETRPRHIALMEKALDPTEDPQDPAFRAADLLDRLGFFSKLRNGLLFDRDLAHSQTAIQPRHFGHIPNHHPLGGTVERPSGHPSEIPELPQPNPRFCASPSRWIREAQSRASADIKKTQTSGNMCCN